MFRGGGYTLVLAYKLNVNTGRGGIPFNSPARGSRDDFNVRDGNVRGGHFAVSDSDSNCSWLFRLKHCSFLPVFIAIGSVIQTQHSELNI
jgi:hypothetical protein